MDSSIIAQILRKLLCEHQQKNYQSLDQQFSKKISENLQIPYIEVDGSKEGLSNSFVKNIQEVVKGNEELISDYTFIASKNNFK